MSKFSNVNHPKVRATGYRGSEDRAAVSTLDKSEGSVKKSVSYRIEFFGENFFFGGGGFVSRDGTV